MEEPYRKQRRSLRDSVLKNPENPSFRDNLFENREHRTNERPNDFIPEGFHSFFNSINEFPSFGFGRMDPFGEDFNEMMNRFFSDFNPESFSDSPFYQQDTDLDEDISRRGLDRALERRPFSDQPFMRGFSHSESTIRKPDGTIEKKVVHRDSQGNVETTITVTNPDGTTEVIKEGGSPLQSILPAPHDYPDYKLPEDKGLFRRIYENIRRFFPD